MTGEQAKLQIEYVPLATLIPFANNPRDHSPAQIRQIADSIKEFGWASPIMVDEDMVIISGHGRAQGAQLLGMKIVPIIRLHGLTEARKRALVIADNQIPLNATWNNDLLKIEMVELQRLDFDLPLLGFDNLRLVDFMSGLSASPSGPGASEAEPGAADRQVQQVSLSDRFGVPPFSVLNAREGWWQARKRSWIALGIQSELGRGENLLKFSDSAALDGKAYNERFTGKGRRRAANAQPSGGGGGLWKKMNEKLAAGRARVQATAKIKS